MISLLIKAFQGRRYCASSYEFNSNCRRILLALFASSFLLASAAQAQFADKATTVGRKVDSYPFAGTSIESDGQNLWLTSKGQRKSFESLLGLPKLALPKVDKRSAAGLDKSKLSSSRSIEILSAVGSFASVRVVDIQSSGMRPYGEARIHVVNLNQPAKKVRLTDFFSNDDILQSFVNAEDAALQQAGQRVKADSGKASDITAFGLSKRFLSEFAFYDLKDDLVTVVFIVGSGGHADGLDRDSFYSIQLKTSASLKEALLGAKQLKTGFLANNRKEIKSLRAVSKSLP